MDWSKQEQAMLGEMKELPVYELTAGEQARMYEQVMRRVRPVRSRRRRRMIYAAAACLAVVVLGSAGYMQRDVLFYGGGAGHVVQGAGRAAEQTFHAVYEVQETAVERVTPEGVSVTAEALKHRMEALGLGNVEIKLVGQKRLSVAASGVVNVEEMKRMLVQPMKVEFKDPDGKVVMTGKDLAPGAHALVDEAGQSMVMVEFKDHAFLHDVTERYVGRQISIWLDGAMIEQPVVQQAVTDGKVVIHTADPKKLAMLLNAGVLPYGIKEVQEW